MTKHSARGGTPPVGIREVAALAGVSPGTVSNSINRPERVADRTRQTVLAAIDQLGFIPNQQARELTGQPSRIIGLVVLDLTSPFFMQLAQSVEATARESGFSMLLCNSENDPEREIELLRLLASHRVRGAIVTPAHGPDRIEDRLSGSVPLVLLDHDATVGGCGVAVDHVLGAREATQHLIELGHTSFAYIAGPADLRQFVQRAQGITEALHDAGFDPTECLTQVYVEGLGIRGGMAAAQHLLASGVPTAVLCANDMLAFGVFRALTKAGLRIPQDVSLVGYDDVEFAADWLVPLTSVSQPTELMGQRAAQLLVEHATDAEGHVHHQVMLRPRLVARASTGPAPSARR